MSDRSWWSHVIQWSLWAAMMALFMGWLGKRRVRRRREDQLGRLVHPVSTLVIGVLVTVMLLGLGLAILMFEPQASAWLPIAVILLSLTSLPLIAAYFLEEHEVTAGHLRYATFYGTKGQMAWKDVTSVSYSPAWKWFTLTDKSGNTARISVMVLGLPELAKAILEHVPETNLAQGLRETLVATVSGNPPSLW